MCVGLGLLLVDSGEGGHVSVHVGEREPRRWVVYMKSCDDT